VRAVVAIVAGVLVGLAAGGIWTWAQPSRYRAESRVLVRPASERIVPAVEALAESSLVEVNVAQTLHLSPPPHVSAKTVKGGLVTVSVEAGSRERARQIDAEAVVILTQKVAQRFTAADVSATVLDPAHATGRTSPTPGRNLLITGLAGLVAGLAAAAVLARRRPHAAAVDPGAERRLRSRIDEVAKRERALARRAGELAAREKKIERREHDLSARDRKLDEREGRMTAVPAPEPAPAPEPLPEPATEPEPEPVPARGGRWTMDELEQFVRERRSASPERVEEWDTYLFLLRQHANVDGSLPPSFDSLIADVFGPTISG
jgi:hypothetical protein